MLVIDNPFDIIRAEDFNTNYKIIAQYFSNPGASYYSNLINRGNFILVGTRGSGKTMLLKSIYLPVYIETLINEKKDPLNHPIDFVGVWVPCADIKFKLFRKNILDFHKKEEEEEKIDFFWRECTGYLWALFLIEHMLNTIIISGPKIGLDFDEPIFHDLTEEICETCQLEYGNTTKKPQFGSLARLIKKQRKRFMSQLKKSVWKINYSIIDDKFDLSAVIDVGKALKRIPRFENSRFYILLDDFFFPNLSYDQQGIILELIRDRNEPLAFKIATIPGGMVFKDDSGFQLMPRGDEFTIESIEFPNLGDNSDYYNLVKDIVNNRLNGYNLTVEDLFEENKDKNKMFLQKLKGQANLFEDIEQEIDVFLHKLKGESGGGHIRPEYAGFGTLVHMSSGVIRTFLFLAKKCVDEWLGQNNQDKIAKEILPIPIKIQTDVINKESSSFLDSVQGTENGMGQYLIKLVHYCGIEARKKLLNNVIANEHIQFQLKEYSGLKAKPRKIITVGITNNVFHSYRLSHRTTRRGVVSVKSFILNRLLTPVLRIPYRDRWRVDLSALEINEILHDKSPIDTSYHKAKSQTSFLDLYCPIVSGQCGRIDPHREKNSCFYAAPIRDDWTFFAKEIFKQQFPSFEVAIEQPPKGDLTCKICEMIHENKFGIYELTELNENVLFELALALSRRKQCFIVVNTEQPLVQQIKGLLGIEYIPYKVVKNEIESICKNKIYPVIELNKKPWNAQLIDDYETDSNDKTVLLVMPCEHQYYEQTLAYGVRKILEKELGFEVVVPSRYSVGKWFPNLIKDIMKAKYCIIDTTPLPNTADDAEDKLSPRQLDYLHRIFLFGLTVGLRKVILNGYNSAFGEKLFTDMQGYCHFAYYDSNLFDEIRKQVPQVFHE